MITKKQFINGVEIIKKYFKAGEQLTNALKLISDIDYVTYDKIIEAYVEILRIAVGDEKHHLNYFIYTLHFGKVKHYLSRTNKTTSEKNFKNAGTLYDYIIKVNK